MFEYLGYYNFYSLLISISCILIAFASGCHRYFFKAKPKKVLPSPKGSRFVLYLTFLKILFRKKQEDLTLIMCLLFQLSCGFCRIFEKDRIFQIFVSTKAFVAFYKPETVEVVLSSTETIDKAKEYSFLHSWLGTGLLTSTGKKWRSRRKLLTPCFHFKILEDFVPIFHEKSDVLVSRLAYLERYPWIDIVPLITACTLDVICETAMGVSINAQGGKGKEYVKAIHENGNIILYRVLKPWLYWDFLFNRSECGKQFNENVKKIHSFSRKVINEKKEEMLKTNALVGKNAICQNNNNTPTQTKKRSAFLESLLKLHFQDPNFTEEDIREEVDTFMFEGHDTTAVSLCWTLYCLGLYKDVQRQVHEELDEIFGDDYDREITREDLTRMKYLECVIKEALRLYPSVPFIGREVTKSFKVLDYTIEEGSMCFIIPYMLHRDPECFPNPEKFDPERFLLENIAGRHPYAYVPFSAGPRNCIGQKFAMMEEKVILANILRNFTLTSRDPRDKVNVTPNLVIRNLEPIRMHFSSRERRQIVNV